MVGKGGSVTHAAGKAAAPEETDAWRAATGKRLGVGSEEGSESVRAGDARPVARIATWEGVASPPSGGGNCCSLELSSSVSSASMASMASCGRLRCDDSRCSGAARCSRRASAEGSEATRLAN